MARTNGGIIGKKNTASFGRCTVTSTNSSGNLTTQNATRVSNVVVIAGGGGGGHDNGGAGGAGGMLAMNCVPMSTATAYPAVVDTPVNVIETLQELGPASW